MAIRFVDGKYYILIISDLFGNIHEEYKDKIIECKTCRHMEPYPRKSSDIAWCQVRHISKFYKILPGPACDFWENNGGHDKFSLIYTT